MAEGDERPQPRVAQVNPAPEQHAEKERKKDGGVIADPHVRERGMEIKVNHPFEPELSLIRNPLTFSGTPVKDYRAPPRLGATTTHRLPGPRGVSSTSSKFSARV